MRRRKVKDSDMLFSVGWENAVLEVRYADAKEKLFRYYGVPQSVFDKIFSESSPGSYWLSVRDNYKGDGATKESTANHRLVGVELGLRQHPSGWFLHLINSLRKYYRLTRTLLRTYKGWSIGPRRGDE